MHSFIWLNAWKEKLAKMFKYSRFCFENIEKLVVLTWTKQLSVAICPFISYLSFHFLLS